MSGSSWISCTSLLILGAACGGKAVNAMDEVATESTGGAPAEPVGGDTSGSTGGSSGALPQLFAQGRDIRALQADATRLYWTEYGTKDSAGNHLRDGKILARAFDSDQIVTIAENLEGPIGLGLSAAHVYVYLDAHGQDTSQSALARVPRTGGNLELLQLDTKPEFRNGSDAWHCDYACFVSNQDYAFWSHDGAVYTVSEDPLSEPFLFLESRGATQLALDETHLYFSASADTPEEAGHTQLWRVHFEGGLPVLIEPEGPLFFQLHEFIYAMNDGYLTQMPKRGGDELRLVHFDGFHATHTNGRSYGKLQVVGELYFAFHRLDHDTSHGPGVVAGSLSNPVAHDFLDAGRYVPWTGSPIGLFGTDSRAIYFSPYASQ